MNKTLLVLKREFLTLIRKPSFLFGMFGVPLIGVAVFFIAAEIKKGGQAQSVLEGMVSGTQTIEIEGYVDHSGIIQNIPASLPSGTLLAFPDEAAARTALQAGEISAFYLVPEDYLASGEVIYVRPDFNPIGGSGQSELFEWVLQVNLLEGDAALATLLNGPLYLEKTSQAPEPQRDEANAMTFFLPYAVTILFYVVILGSASLLLSSVAKEKENRVMEVLMSSVTPRQLLAGKITGLGLLGLLQTAVWMGTSYGLLKLSGETFSLPAAFQLPASFLVWGLIFFLLGFAVYASLMAGLGALVPNLREALPINHCSHCPADHPDVFDQRSDQRPAWHCLDHHEPLSPDRAGSHDDPPLVWRGAVLAGCLVSIAVGRHGSPGGAGGSRHVPRPGIALGAVFQSKNVL